MRKRQKYKAPDGRDWRDKDMPVYTRAMDKAGNVVMTTFDHVTYKQYFVDKFAFYDMASYDPRVPPSYKNDPSYWWANATKGKQK